MFLFSFLLFYKLLNFNHFDFHVIANGMKYNTVIPAKAGIPSCLQGIAGLPRNDVVCFFIMFIIFVFSPTHFLLWIASGFALAMTGFQLKKKRQTLT